MHEYNKLDKYQKIRNLSETKSKYFNDYEIVRFSNVLNKICD